MGEYRQSGRTEAQAQYLTDLLLARCAELDNQAADFAQSLPSDVKQVTIPGKTLFVQVGDVTPDGDLIRVTERSCVDAKLFEQVFSATQAKSPIFQVQVDEPETVVQFEITLLKAAGDDGITSPTISAGASPNSLNTKVSPDFLEVGEGAENSKVVQAFVVTGDSSQTAADKPAKVIRAAKAAPVTKVAKVSATPRPIMGPLAVAPATASGRQRRP